MQPDAEKIGVSDNVGVMEPKKVSKSLNLHEENNMQQNLPQNGGEIAADAQMCQGDDEA